MKKYVFESMSFYEGGCGSTTDIIARKSLFKNKEDFIKWLITDSEEYESYIDYLYPNETMPLTEEDVKESYVRYFKNFGEDSGIEIESGYTFCKKARGAFEVYCINF